MSSLIEMIMGQLWLLALLFVCLANSHGLAQTRASVERPTKIPRKGLIDTTKVGSPSSLTFTASTDQRFFFFNDTRNERDRLTPISVYGVRAGFLFPPQQKRENLQGGRGASFKAGVGFYFLNQDIDQPGLLPDTRASITRRLRYGTLYYERYLLRRKAFEVSLPLEIGFGTSKYERNDVESNEYILARGNFIPVGVGVSAAYQFPSVRWFTPIHWFGLNMLVGYRYILKKDIPESQINYNGFYISVGPSFFLENMTADIKRWRKRHQQRKATKNK
jgi:hypothetical protein